jgi:hypothetical protein
MMSDFRALRLQSEAVSKATPASAASPPPPPMPVQATGAVVSVRPHKDDGFLAAATLGGALGSAVILILVPICIFAFTRVKGALVEEAAPEAVAIVSGDEAPAASVEVTPVSEPVVPAPEVEWPAIVLTGTLAGKQGRAGSAILNGEVVNLHQALSGVRVLDVASQQVVLGYQGVRKMLRVGESTR